MQKPVDHWGRHNKTGLWVALAANIAGVLVSSYYGNTTMMAVCGAVVGWVLWDIKVAYDRS